MGQKISSKTWFVILFLWTVIGSSLLGFWAIQTGIRQSAETLMKRQEGIMRLLGTYVLSSSSTTTNFAHPADKAPLSQLRITVLDSHSHVIKDSHFQGLSTHEDRPEVARALQGYIGTAQRFSKTSKDDLYYMAFPVTKAGTTVGVSRLALPLGTLKQVENQVLTRITPFFVAFVLGILGIIWMGQAANKRRLHQLTDALKANKPEQFAYTQPEDADDEEIAQVCLNFTEKLAIASLQKESALEEKKAILDNLKERVLLINSQEQIVHLNPAAKQLFSVSQEKAMQVSQVCRNSTFVEAVTQTLKNNALTDKKILFQTKNAPILLSVTGVPVLLNKQIHALMLLATPTYTWMPTYTRLIRLWIEQRHHPHADLWLTVLNDTHAKLCKGQVNRIPHTIEELTLAAKDLGLSLTTETSGSPQYKVATDMTVFLAVLVSLHLNGVAETKLIEDTAGLTVRIPGTSGLEPTILKFVEELVAYFESSVSKSDTDLYIHFIIERA